MNDFEFWLMVLGMVAPPCLFAALNRVQLYKGAIRKVQRDLDTLHELSSAAEIKLAVVEAYETTELALQYRLLNYTHSVFARQRQKAYRASTDYRTYMSRTDELRAIIAKEEAARTAVQRADRESILRWVGFFSRRRKSIFDGR